MISWLKAHREAILVVVVAMQAIPAIPSWIRELAKATSNLAFGM